MTQHLDPAVRTVLRHVPELGTLQLNPSAARWLLGKSKTLTWVDRGVFRYVVDLGDGTVARLFREYAHPDEAVDRVGYVCSPFEEPRTLVTLDDLHIEVMSRLDEVSDAEFLHLVIVMLEHGANWIDCKPKNAGKTRDGRARLVAYDGAVEPITELDDVRVYQLCDRFAGPLEDVAVTGCGTGRALYRRMPQLDVAHQWVRDDTVYRHFWNTPHGKDPLLTISSLQPPELRALVAAGGGPPITLRWTQPTSGLSE